MTSKGARAARTESLFRAVNEHVTATTEVVDETPVVCECTDPSCIDHVHVPLKRYEQVRAEPTHFIVKPGHVEPDVERVVVDGRGYEVVEKDDPHAAEVSETLDARV